MWNMLLCDNYYQWLILIKYLLIIHCIIFCIHRDQYHFATKVSPVYDDKVCEASIINYLTCFNLAAGNILLLC